MKVLIVCSGNAGKITAFISEQAIALEEQGIIIDYYPIVGKGIVGYLKNFPSLKKKIREFKPDLIHAHYGLSGALAILQLRIPVVITFHDGETHSVKSNIISSISTLFSAYDIFVARHIFDLIYLKKKSKSVILPCGVSYKTIQPVDKNEAMVKMNLSFSKKYILFGGAFENLRKNYPLLKEAISLMNRDDIKVIEMKDLNRQQITMLMCACDVFVLPSKREGSPQALKEAMLCNCPIVATDVGDIKRLMSDTEGCFICTFEPLDVAEKIQMALDFGKRTNGREKLNHLDNSLIAARIIEIYNKIIS
jgi:glycosyltransferase involved in cell wall biosynthesis